MGVSKVVYGDDTLVDLTGDTVTPTSLTLGATAHGADGEPIVGEYQYVLPPMSSDIRGGARIQPDSGLEITDTDNLQVRLALESDGTVRGGIAELTAQGHAEQDGTPTPDNPVPIQVVRGRNLLDADNATVTASRATYTRANGSLTVTATSGNYWQFVYFSVPISATGPYSLSFKAITNGTYFVEFGAYNGDTRLSVASTSSGSSLSIEADAGAATLRCMFYARNSASGNTGDSATYSSIQLNAGSTPQPYVPYGHVGMEARDPDTDELISCTALPLPSRGWVAGLPDGTADSLRLDGAGKCEWTLPTSEVVLDGSEAFAGQGNRVGLPIQQSQIARSVPSDNTVPILLSTHFIPNSANNSYRGIQSIAQSTNGANLYFADGTGSMVLADFKTWLSTHNVTVLYPLATPVTEDCGYVDMPEISGECQVSIPELDEVGIKYFVDSAVTELARQWYARAYAELGDAVTELAGRVAALES